MFAHDRTRPRRVALGGGTLVVEPPAACDKLMIRDGVESKRPAILELGDRAWWLREILSAVPTRAIAAILGATPAAIIAAGRGSDWESALTPSWTVAAIRNRDAEWAEGLLEANAGQPYPLWDPVPRFRAAALLSPDRREAFVLQRLRSDPGPLRSGHPAFGFVHSLSETVSPTVAREILQRVRLIVTEEGTKFADPARRAEMWKQRDRRYDYQYHEPETGMIIHGLATILPFEVLDEASADMPDADDIPLFYDGAYREMLDRLRFRRDMHQEFAP